MPANGRWDLIRRLKFNTALNFGERKDLRVQACVLNTMIGYNRLFSSLPQTTV